MASGTRGSSVSRFSTTGRATSLQHVLKIVLECDLTSPLYLSVLQHFGGDEDKFNVIDYFLCDQTYFWKPVYYKLDDSDFPSDSREKRGHFVGISESVGHAMTFKILMDDTLKVIHRSNVRSALNPHAKNLRLDPLEPGDVATPIVKSCHDSADDGEILPLMPVIDPSELISCTFLMDKEDGQ
jgi:hypothetical protein